MTDADRATSDYHCPYCSAPVVLDSSVPGPVHGDLPCRTCGKMLWFVRKHHNDAVVLAFLPGLITGSEPVSRVNEVLEALGPAQTAVMNLSKLRFVSSVFLSMLVALNRRMIAGEGHVRLCNLPPVAREAFESTRLNTLFPLFDDEASALK